MSEQSADGTQQIPLSQSARPQAARDALARRADAREFLREHDKRLSVLAGEMQLSGYMHPYLAISSVWRNPDADGAQQRLDWGKRTHHAILDDEEPEWEYCPCCGEALPS